MTRLLVTADLHLESGLAYADDRLADQKAVLFDIVQVAREREAELVLLAGDIFHRPRPTPAALMVFRGFLRELEMLGVPAIAVHGNLSHDVENGDRASALELFASDWFRVARHPEVIRAAGDVAVCCLPSVPVARLVAARNGGDRAEIFQEAAEALLEIARGLKAQAPDGWPTVLLAHFAISGAALPTGLPTDTLHEPILPLEELEAIGFDCVAAGHIHKPQHLSSLAPDDEVMPILYAGSPLCQNFGEASFDHGIWIVDLDEGYPITEFVQLESRPFVTVDIDLTDPRESRDENEAVADAIVAAAEDSSLDGAVMRIRYRATEGQHRRLDQRALRGFCMEAGAHRVYQVQPDIVRASRARSESVDATTEPLDALDAWITAEELAEGEADALRALTRELLAEVVA